MASLGYIKIPVDHLEAIELLGDAEKGRLLTSLMVYAKTGEALELGGNERYIFAVLKTYIDREIEKEEALAQEQSKKSDLISKIRSEAGKQGGRGKKQTKANESKEKQKKQKKQKKQNALFAFEEREEKEEEGSPLVPPSPSPPTPPLSLSPYNPPSPEEEKEEKDAGSDGKPSDKRLRQNSIPYTEVQRLFNATCKSYSRCTVLSDARKKAIGARFNSGYTLEAFERLFAKAEASSFLRGQNNKNWQANFDWLIRDANMAKVLDGNYDDERRRRGDGGAPQSNGEDRPRKYGNFGIVL